MAMETSVTSTPREISKLIEPPPMFSPNVFIPELHEKKSFGPRGYSNRLAYIIDRAAYPVLETAQKYNFSINWKRKLEVHVHEARDITPQFGYCQQELRCKVTVGNQIGRTQLVAIPPRSNNVTWEQRLKFNVEEPCNIKIEVYATKIILPNDVIGHITISPNQLVERSTVTKWFPFNTHGEVKLSISLAPPEMTPFKFTLKTPITLSFRDCHLLNPRGEKVFTIMGSWPHHISILDARDLSILTIKNKVFENHEKVFRVYQFGQTESSVSITWYSLQSTTKLYLEGISNVSQVVYYKRTFKFCHGDTCVAYVNHTGKKFEIEIRACQEMLLLLASVIAVAKLLDS